MEPFFIHPDIAHAQIPPSRFYRDPELYALQLERLFAPRWHVLGPAPEEANFAAPMTLLEGSLDEPLVVTRSADRTLRCLSNVCTHRGKTVVESAGRCRVLRCRYHGRRFRHDGALATAPGFEGAEGFPRRSDDLGEVPFGALGPILFASAAPEAPFEAALDPLVERLDWWPWDALRFDSEASRDYLVEAHWALYCDNYLEGFHIPYVHPGLSDALELPTYETELFEGGSLQLGVASGPEEPTLEPPPGHPDHGRRLAAYYFWLLPGTMINVYPWGVSVNAVEPLSVSRTRVRFLSFVLRPELQDSGAGAALHQVELEDEAVVEDVQRGLASRFYHRGRYAPRHERGVHHFHRLAVERLFG